MTIDVAKQFNDAAAIFTKFKPTWAWKQYIRLPHSTIGLFTGNQSMKTSSTAAQYVLRILGKHPIPRKNILYFECENLQKEKEEASNLNDEGCITHPPIGRKLVDGKVLYTHYKGEYTVETFPQDAKCTHCNGSVKIHQRGSHVFRFCSETLPGEKDTSGRGEGEGQSSEVKNTVYPEFKKWLPAFLIKKDITYRRPTLILHNPWRGVQFGDQVYPGDDILIEFVSYSQTVQAGAGVQRVSVWCDEEPPYDFYQEQLPRLIAEDGDFILTLTPANKISWAYDEIFERARIYIRTEAVTEFLTGVENRAISQVEWTDSVRDIAVIQAATDDNPTLSKSAIERRYIYDDEDSLATRRYGLFRQATGRVFNNMNYNVHVIRYKTWFKKGMYYEWVHARSIDYHERNPLAVVWVSMSPYDEAFVWMEWNPSPLSWTNDRIAEEIANRSDGYRFVFNGIDPLANKVQTNTGKTVVEDLNREFMRLKKGGIGMGGYWEPFDTKGLKGREEIRKRLNNALHVKKPFNNMIEYEGKQLRLPTLWICDTCPQTAKSLKQWRYEEFNPREVANKDKKEVASQKWSHFCTALEAVFKDVRFRPRKQWGMSAPQRKPTYFRSGR